ncbi:MAG: phytoene desaturase family protein [Fibrobacterota bacterium]
METYDAIIAGAGLGGLFAGAKLAREGKKILLVEKHTVPGGYASVFKRKGYTFEASLHALNDVDNKKSANFRVFNEFGLMDTLNFFRIPEFFHLQSPAFTITVPDSITEATKVLTEQFPEEAPVIESFMDTVLKIENQIRQYKKLGWKLFLLGPLIPFVFKEMIGNIKKSTAEYLDEITDNEKLKMTLCALTHYFHDDPCTYSFIHYCAAHGSFLRGGASFPAEGSFGISQYLADYIEKRGGTIRYSSEMQETLINNSEVQGIVYYDLKKKQRNTAYAKKIIANLPHPVLVKTLPEKEQTVFEEKYGTYTLSSSMFCVYFGLKRPLRDLGSTKYSTILLPDAAKTIHDFGKCYQAPNYGERIIDLTDYSILEHFDAPDKPTATAIVIDTIDAWENLSRENYLKKKQKHTEEIVETLEKHMHGFRDNIAYMESATPKTYERYTSNPSGAVYGYAQNPRQMGPFRPKEKSPVKGLYIASGWGSPGGGMTAVAKAGYKAAQRVLKDS